MMGTLEGKIRLNNDVTPMTTTLLPKANVHFVQLPYVVFGVNTISRMQLRYHKQQRTSTNGIPNLARIDQTFCGKMSVQSNKELPL
jgi:hypothetical protein